MQLINRVFSTTDPLTALNGKCQTGGRLNLHRALTSIDARPRNDHFANSYEIKMPSGQTQLTATGNNVDATSETGEPVHGGPGASRSVWWRWTATSTGTVEFRTQGSTFNTRLAVYTGSSVSSLTLVPGATSVVTDGCSWSQVSFTAATGTTYRIAVDGYWPQSSAEVGSIKLTLRTSGTTSQTSLSFDRTTLQRPSGQFKARVVGPASQTVTLDRFNSSTATWVLSHASFALSAQGIYDYTDTQASAPHHLYRCQIGTLKSCNAVGYADVSVAANVQKMIANPLNAVDNRISALFPNPPEGFILYKWNEVSDQMQIADGNATLAPGEGAIALSETTFKHSFIGEVRQGYLINPVPSGFSIRGSMRPISGGVVSALGTAILEGDIVSRMVSGAYQNFAYRNGFWINDAGAQVAEPEILVGESFWINKPTDWEQISSVWP